MLSLCTRLALLAGLSVAADSSKYKVKTPPLTTPWTYEVGTNPWPEYPRPQLQRSQWKSLNGIWNYKNASGLDALNDPPEASTLPYAVLIPSCLESGLSGIQAAPGAALYSWFSTTFNVPHSFGDQDILLSFGAVDYEATVFVNGHNATFHRGGYFTFTVDITAYLRRGDNELLIFVHDPTDTGEYVIPIGKQVTQPSHIFYTPCSGIWQSVWIEAAPSNYISQLNVAADMHGNLNVTVHSAHTSSASATIALYERQSTGGYHGHSNDRGRRPIATHRGSVNKPFLFSVSNPKLWSPESPDLYDIAVTFGTDKISSYTGFRSLEKGAVNGVTRALLNGEPIFQFGTLDQGYWPDGIYTPPNRDAMVYDLQVLKKLGFNMLRKHIKVENALFYQACDEMGLLLIQDMPALRPLQSVTDRNCTTTTILPNAAQQAEFTRQLELLINQLKSYPSIGTWVIYNEGWGQLLYPQLPEFGLTDIVRSLDPTRLIDATTGWYDHGAGDYSDNHHYANPQCGSPFYSIQSSPYDPQRY
jgi:beta-galactosidase/beta-glucuronidase